MNEDEIKESAESTEDSVFELEDITFSNNESSGIESSEEFSYETNEHGDASDWREWIYNYAVQYAEEKGIIYDKVEDVPYSPEEISKMAASAVTELDVSEYSVFKLSNGYYAVFSNDTEIELIGDRLVNMGGSNITGLYLPSLSGFNANANNRTITIIPYTSSNIARNGTNTYYTVINQSGTGWTSTNYYINVTAEDKSKVGHSVTGFQWFVIIALSILVFIVAVRNLFHD